MKTTFNTLGLAVLLAFGCGDDDGGGNPDTGPGTDSAVPDTGTTDSGGGEDSGTDGGPGVDADVDAAIPPTEGTYAFGSRFVDGASSVVYSGQTYRHLLINQLSNYVKSGLAVDIENGIVTSSDEVVPELDYFFRFDAAANRGDEIGLTTSPAPLQVNWEDVNPTSTPNILGKTAGNDDSTDHTDWDMPGNFVGWDDDSINGGESIDSPTELIDALFATLATNAFANPMSPSGEELPVFVTPEGLDLQQLIQKCLLMFVAFSQGVDDYLDDDVEGKGILNTNVRNSDTSPYSSLEHVWDEAFGYFGMPRDGDLYTDDELAKAGGRDDWQGAHDTSGDDRISFASEFAFGAAVNAAKRDRAAVDATDFTADAFSAFMAGRTIIDEADETLTDEEMTMLTTHRDAIVEAWEKAIAATAVHYVNDTLSDMADIGTDDYSFEDHAKHWSELKGFSIGLQFNRNSPLLEEDGGETLFARMQALIGDRPVLTGDTELAEYRTALLEVRDIFRDAYEFTNANVEAW
ncbi:MAG: DUF4856 domain-containing protein [Myxococcota bacterium]